MSGKTNLLRRAAGFAPLPLLMTLSIGIPASQRCSAQTPTRPSTKIEVAQLDDIDSPSSKENTSSAAAKTRESSAKAASSADPEITPAVAKELEALKQRIEQLETELKSRAASDRSVSPVTEATSNLVEPGHTTATVEPAKTESSSAQTPAVSPPPAAESAGPAAPFAYADWTWLNGNARNKDAVWDSKYFTPEFRVDTHFMQDYNQPKDHTMGGSTESYRAGEVQLEQLSFGGDLHVGNIRARILTMYGLFATTTPRNDSSAGTGQWNLNDAYRYFSEAWGGYHFNVNHGLNIDAGIFVSYIGLFSYYNFDNWTYQPSFVSSNTPWVFNGVRIQWFPTDKLKIEPWIINGWQSYAKTNGHIGLGGQILWRPKPWLSLVFNNYGMGTDTLGVPGRSRIHTDDSVEVRYYDQPQNTGLSKMAFSATGDLGCEYGGNGPGTGTNVSCHNNSHGNPKQSFAGWMIYNRMWFNRDKIGFTLGGGVLDNPGRYLTLLPPINGATAVSGSPYFPAYPGSVYKGWDASATFDWMPAQYITFRFETGYRHANAPYWSGRGGITPPGGNVGPVANNGSVGSAASYICTNGSTSAVSSFAPSGFGFGVDNATGAVTTSCMNSYGSTWNAWQPDLRRGQAVNILAIMVKF